MLQTGAELGLLLSAQEDNELDRWVEIVTVRASRQVQVLLEGMKRVWGLARASQAASPVITSVMGRARLVPRKLAGAWRAHKYTMSDYLGPFAPCEKPSVCLWTTCAPVLPPTFTFYLFKVNNRTNKLSVNLKRSRILEAILSLHKHRRDGCHTCSSRSPSEKPATSTLLPLCPLTPELTRLVLLDLVDAAAKVKNRKSYLTHTATSQTRACWMMKSVFCQASWPFHLSWQVYSDSATDLFNDLGDSFFCTIESFVSCHMWNVKQVFIIFASDEIMTASALTAAATPSWRSDVIWERSFRSEQIHLSGTGPATRGRLFNVYKRRTKTFRLTRTETKCDLNISG